MKIVLYDETCEELSFPQYFSKGRFVSSVERDVKLTPSKYLNQRLLNYEQNFASNRGYILFAQPIL